MRSSIIAKTTIRLTRKGENSSSNQESNKDRNPTMTIHLKLVKFSKVNSIIFSMKILQKIFISLKTTSDHFYKATNTQQS